LETAIVFVFDLEHKPAYQMALEGVVCGLDLCFVYVCA